MSNLLSTNTHVGKGTYSFPVHALYTKYASQWEDIRDALEGEDQVKSRGVRYLPKLKSQKKADYDAYKLRAVFFEISSRILSVNTNVIVRRTPTIKYDKGMEPYFSQDDMSFLSFNELRRQLTKELSSVGRVAVLIEVNNGMFVPKVIPTEAILNWSEDDDGNIISVLIATSVTTTDPKKFSSTTEMRYYRLEVIDGQYTQTEIGANGSDMDSVVPSVNGTGFDHIPLYCINPFGVSIEPRKAPISSIVSINYSHYRTSASLENGRHLVGIPTPWVTGGTASQELMLGGESAWVIPNDKAKVGFLEFIGQGLGSLERALEEKQSQMSQFSAQLMDTSSKGSEAEGTVRLRYGSDAASLTDIALSTETCLRLVYSDIAKAIGSVKPEIELNKDFIATKMTYNELTALTKSLVDGAITEEIFLYNLERGEMIPENTAGDHKIKVKRNDAPESKPTTKEEI